MAVVELVLEAAPERLRGCVVAALSGAAQRSGQSHVEAFPDDGLRRILRPSSVVKYCCTASVMARELRHPQRVDGDGRALVVVEPGEHPEGRRVVAQQWPRCPTGSQ